ncbi:hypothetical protein K2X33_02885 [bacterium]|nr:hypothetical protein [bacterium]
MGGILYRLLGILMVLGGTLARAHQARPMPLYLVSPSALGALQQANADAYAFYDWTGIGEIGQGHAVFNAERLEGVFFEVVGQPGVNRLILRPASAQETVQTVRALVGALVTAKPKQLVFHFPDADSATRKGLVDILVHAGYPAAHMDHEVAFLQTRGKHYVPRFGTQELRVSWTFPTTHCPQIVVDPHQTPTDTDTWTH